MHGNVSRLADILSQLGLTSRHLAEILNVHYSLVSKWLNNKRPLKYNSAYLKNLVEVLISIDTPRNVSTVRAILRETYPDADLSTPEKVAVYLLNYLASDDPDARLNSIEEVDPRQVYARAKIDIYRKFSGRRDALMRLLDTAIALSPGQELMLFSEETLSWHIDDEAFRREWLEKHKEILHLGNRVTMLHTVDRQEEHLLHTITQWLPLHLTGMTTAYYLPEYSDSIFKPSLSILRNRAVMSGITATGFSDMLYTYYTSAPHFVREAELMFDGLLANSRPLFEKLERDNITRNMLDAAYRKDNSYNFSGLPLKLALDSEDFSGVLRENEISGEQYDRCTAFFSKYQDVLLDTMETAFTRQILDLAVLERGVSEGSAVSEFNWITEKNLFVSPRYFKRGLRGLVERLQRNPKFSIALVNDYALPHVRKVSLLIKENTITIANSRAEKTPCPLVIKEPSIIHTFFKYFSHYWDSIPRIQRDRENVVHRLNHLAE
jgi:transcriptional regulator with XRE-family HTH domain